MSGELTSIAIAILDNYDLENSDEDLNKIYSFCVKIAQEKYGLEIWNADEVASIVCKNI